MGRGTFIAVCVAALGVLLFTPGCRTGDPLTESFRKDRVGSLKRGVERAMQSQAVATDDLLASVEQASSAEMAAMPPSLAYDLCKRLALRSQSRHRTTIQSLDKAEQTADEVFAQWRKEVRRYNDQDIRARAEEGLRARRAEFNSAIEEIRAATKAVPPVQQELGDRTLYFKHVRDEGAGADMPPFSTEALERMESARRDLRERTAKARATVTRLVADDTLDWPPNEAPRAELN